MVYSAQTILRLRFIALIAVRVGVAVLLFLRVMPGLAAISHSTTASWGGMSRFAVAWQVFASSFPALLLALAILVLDRRLVRWLIPMPGWACPGCGYELSDSTPAQCPECGARLRTGSAGPEAGRGPVN